MDSQDILPSVEIHRASGANSGTAISLTFEHAQKLFRRQHKRGKKLFILKKDSPYKLSKNGDLNLSPSKTSSNRTKGESGPTKSEKA